MNRTFIKHNLKKVEMGTYDIEAAGLLWESCVFRPCAKKKKKLNSNNKKQDML